MAIQLSDNDILNLRRLAIKVQGIRGDGVKHYDTGITITSSPPGRRTINPTVPSDFIPVMLAVDGRRGYPDSGSVSDPQDDPSTGDRDRDYTYTMRRMNGVVLAKNVPVKTLRQHGLAALRPGTRGFAIYNSSKSADDPQGTAGNQNGLPSTGPASADSSGGVVLQRWELWFPDESYEDTDCADVDASTADDTGDEGTM